MGAAVLGPVLDKAWKNIIQVLYGKSGYEEKRDQKA